VSEVAAFHAENRGKRDVRQMVDRNERFGWVLALALLAACVSVLAFFPTATDDAPLYVAGGLAGVALLLMAGRRPVLVIETYLIIWAPSIFVLMERNVGVLGNVEMRFTRVLGGAIAVILAGCFVRALVRKSRVPIPGAVLFYGAFVVFYLASLLWSPDVGDGASDALRVVTSALVFAVLCIEVRTSRDVEAVHRALTIGLWTAAVITSYLWLNGGAEFVANEAGHRYGRTMGASGDPNSSGLLAVIGFASYILYLHRSIGRRRIILWALGVVPFVVAIACTLSRTAILEMAVFLTIFLLVDRSVALGWSWKVVIVGFVLAALGASLYAKGLDQIERRLADVPGVSKVQADRAGSGRFFIWRGYLHEIENGSVADTLSGRGAGASVVLSGRFLGVTFGPHNEYLYVLYELGVIGMALFLAFNIACLRRLYGMMRRGPADTRMMGSAAFALVVAYLLTDEVFGWGIPLLGSRLYLLGFLGMALSAARVGAPHLLARPATGVAR